MTRDYEKEQKEIMFKCRKIIHREVGSIYKDAVLDSLKPSKRLNVAINAIAQAIGQELGVDAKTVVLMLMWDKILQEYKTQEKINEILRTDPKYQKLLEIERQQKNDLEKEEKKVRRAKRQTVKVQKRKKELGI